MGEVRVILVIIFLISLTTALHLQAWRGLREWLPRLTHRPGLATLLMILSLVLVHTAEVALFAVGYAWSVQWASMGSLEGNLTGGWWDYAYFSASVYTTMGFGDVVPIGPVRLMAGMESITGLLMIAWSGAFTYIQMQRFWGKPA